MFGINVSETIVWRFARAALLSQGTEYPRVSAVALPPPLYLMRRRVSLSPNRPTEQHRQQRNSTDE